MILEFIKIKVQIWKMIGKLTSYNERGWIMVLML